MHCPEPEKLSSSIFNLKKHSHFNSPSRRSPSLPKNNPKSIYHSPNPINEAYSNHQDISKMVNIRPGVVECFKRLKHHFEIIIFTTSQKSYSNAIIDIIDPDCSLVDYRLFQEDCHTTQEGILIKDLRIFSNRHPRDLIIIDSSALSYGFHFNNGVPIIPFTSNKDDREMYDLTDFLLPLHATHIDIRPVIKLIFKPHLFMKYAHDIDLLSEFIVQYNQDV